MKILFCEDCGSKNIVPPGVMDTIDEQQLKCQVCNSQISRNTIISYTSSGKDIDTSMYRILFIDDDLGHLKLMATVLKKEYNFSMAATGKQGIELANKNKPDLILLDVNMPDMDGYQVCATLKANKKTRHIPVIFITAQTGGGEEYRGLALGAVDYISKPFNLQILHARIAMQLKAKLMQESYNCQNKELNDLVSSLKDKYLEIEIEQETVQQEKDTFEKVLDAIDDNVIIQDKEEQITWFNKTAKKNLKSKTSTLIIKLCHELFLDFKDTYGDKRSSGKNANVFSDPTKIYSDSLNTYISRSHLPIFSDEGELSSVVHLVKITTNAGESH